MLGIVLIGSLAFAILAIVAPTTAASLAAKEGPLEHLSHAILPLALFAWAVAAARARGPEAKTERFIAIGLCLTCAIILGEELDWGSVYGITLLGDRLAAATGRANLHNAWSGGSYLLFALLPLTLIGVVGWRRGHTPGRLPGRRDAVGLIALGALSLGASLAWPAGEGLVDEVGETLLYLSLLWIAVRPITRR